MNERSSSPPQRRRHARALFAFAAGLLLAGSLASGCTQDDCGDPSMHPDLSTSVISADMRPPADLEPTDGGTHD
jgi:hypothetical protein